jgi:hypothetical protein
MIRTIRVHYVLLLLLIAGPRARSRGLPQLIPPQKKVAWNKGKHMSAETREKMSVAMKERWQQAPFVELMQKKQVAFQKGDTPWNKGKRMSEETRERMRASRTGKSHSMETRALMSERASGRKLSDATRAKLSAARKGRTQKPLHRQRIAHAMRVKWAKVRSSRCR